MNQLERYIPVPEAGCWLWGGSISQDGYGFLPLGVQNKKMYAHRYFYRELKGPIPDGLCVCHKCDTPMCVNPDHLFLGTRGDNNRDRTAKGRCRGEWNGRALLTLAQVREIRASTLGAARLAQEYGVSRGAIRDILTGDSWRHA